MKNTGQLEVIAQRLDGLLVDHRDFIHRDVKEYQGQDFGYKLVKYAITFLKKNKVKLLWCDARINAIPFYEKTGLKTIGDFYSIPKIGRHKLMYIYL